MHPIPQAIQPYHEVYFEIIEKLAQTMYQAHRDGKDPWAVVDIGFAAQTFRKHPDEIVMDLDDKFMAKIEGYEGSTDL